MITIESLTPDHFPDATRWLSNPEINRWLTSDWRGRGVDSSAVAIACRNRRNRLCLVRASGIPCGLVALADIDAADRCAMVWYLLGERQRGQGGIISEAVRLLCHSGFAEMGLSCIYAWIMRPNAASRRVLQRNGFREVGAIRAATTCDGETVDRVYFDLVPSDVASANASE